MILRINDYIKLNKSYFNNEQKPFRLEETKKIDFDKEYKITELYDGGSVSLIDTENTSDFIFWVEEINMELCDEHLLN